MTTTKTDRSAVETYRGLVDTWERAMYVAGLLLGSSDHERARVYRVDVGPHVFAGQPYGWRIIATRSP